MRIAVTAAVIVIAATSAGCGGGSSSSPATRAQSTTARTATQSAPAPPTTAQAPNTTTRAATTTTAGSRHGAKNVPDQLVGHRLDVAERVLHKAGISYKVIRLHNHATGSASGWGVCETTPSAGKPVPHGRVDLIVVHAKCGAR